MEPMPKAAAEALRALAAHLVQEAESQQRMARVALAQARRLDRDEARRGRPRSSVGGAAAEQGRPA
jgi:hypothetical protein